MDNREEDEDDVMVGGTSVGVGAGSARIANALWVLWFVFLAIYLFS